MPEGRLDVRLWNGAATVQVDGRDVSPGVQTVPAGHHNVAGLLDGVPFSDEPVDVPAAGSARVHLVVPPPRSALAVVVENQADARPQSGLAAADVVYEALAEGGITRFLAVYLSGDAPSVGPVRSLRHYFSLLAAEYPADLVHVGASPQGFAWRDALRLGKLDESAGDPGVWRSRARAAPHNAYTDTAVDRELLEARGGQRGSSWGPLRFAPDVQPEGEPVAAFSVGFLPFPYSVSYAWDEERNGYRRFMDGTEQVDPETREQIAPTSVVVQFAEVQPIPGDPQGRLDVDLAGAHGRLLVFSQGVAREGTWRKALPQEVTAWTDAHGDPLALPPGPVWVELVPLTASVDW